MSAVFQISRELKTVVFDCDGVLFDTNYIKSDSFAEVIGKEYPLHVDEFIKFHNANGGISRYEKFNWFFRDFLNESKWEELSNSASSKFANLLKSKLLDAKILPGVVELLNALRNRGIECHVISGGDHDEVNQLIYDRGLSQYFMKVLGSPITKITHLDNLKAAGLLQKPGLFIGDANSDLEAAKAHDLYFIFVSNYSLWKHGAQKTLAEGGTVVVDLTEVSAFV